MQCSQAHVESYLVVLVELLKSDCEQVTEEKAFNCTIRCGKVLKLNPIQIHSICR